MVKRLQIFLILTLMVFFTWQTKSFAAQHPAYKPNVVLPLLQGLIDSNTALDRAINLGNSDHIQGTIKGILGLIYRISERQSHEPESNDQLDDIFTPSTMLTAAVSTTKLALPEFTKNQRDDYLFRLGGKVTQQEISFLSEKLSKVCINPISERESECLCYLIRGKSARETGIALNLSQRTIESYLDSLKAKLNCRKKTDLINMIFELFT